MTQHRGHHRLSLLILALKLLAVALLMPKFLLKLYLLLQLTDLLLVLGLLDFVQLSVVSLLHLHSFRALFFLLTWFSSVNLVSILRLKERLIELFLLLIHIIILSLVGLRILKLLVYFLLEVFFLLLPVLLLLQKSLVVVVHIPFNFHHYFN